MQPWP